MMGWAIGIAFAAIYVMGWVWLYRATDDRIGL